MIGFSGLMVAPVVDQENLWRMVHFPASGDEWVDYWHTTPPGTVYTGNTTVNISAPLTYLPLFQRRGSVVPLLDLDRADTLVLRTHSSAGTGHVATVYDDDGISTRADTHKEFFKLHASTSFPPSWPAEGKAHLRNQAPLDNGGRRRLQQAIMSVRHRVVHAGWQPAWNRVRWEITGVGLGLVDASSGPWGSAVHVVCGGVELPMAPMASVRSTATMDRGYWAVQGGTAVITLPLVAHAEWAVHCDIFSELK